jgi:hypothetical protein
MRATDDAEHTNSTASTASAAGDRYELRVQGRIGPSWEAYFDGMTVSLRDDGTTAISGTVVDQAALHGLLHKLRDIGIPLLSLTRTTGAVAEPDPTGHSTSEPQPLDHPEGN